MAGGSEINNELTLDVTQFTKNLERATNKLDSLGKKIENVDARSGKLEKDFQKLGTNVSQASKKLGAVTENLDGLAGGLDRAQKSIKKSGDSSKRLSQDLSELAQSARESQTAMSSVGEWTAYYGKALDQLRPKMENIVQSKRNLAQVSEKMTKAEVRSIQTSIQARIKDLNNEKATNNEKIKARKEMVAQLEQLERRAEISAAYVRADAFKTNSQGKEVRRYVGKNSGKHNELMAELNSYKEEANLARQQKANISAIVGELKYRNGELNKALSTEQSLLNVNKQTLASEKEQVAQAKILAEEKKRSLQSQKTQEKELARQQKATHQEQMKMLKEEQSQRHEMAKLVAGGAAVGAAGKGIDQIASYQDTMDRLRAYNFSQAEFDQIMARTEKLTQSNKFLSKTEAVQGNIDAISALAHNAPEFIDKTLDSVMKDAFILRSKGYDSGTQSDLVKNLYGAIEARGLTRDEDADAAEKTSDLLRRMVIASGGKVTVSDIEAVFRNAGDSVMTMSDEGWLKVLPLIEQNKTAGGGNGGGGGVTRVGTMIKMLSLMASGRKLTNTAALNFLGSDMMNDLYADGADQDFTKIAQNNDVIQRSIVNAGFKNQDKISQDPVGALMAMRGGILDFMMRDDKFSTFFGNKEKHTYNDKGEMVQKNGEIVDSRRQNEVEMAAFKKFLAQSGISNNNVTGFATTMNAAYAQRAEHSVETAQNTKGREELLSDLSENWNNNVKQLETSLANLAITFEPLLSQLVAIPKAIAEIVNGITEFSKQHNVIATVGIAFVGLKATMMGLSSVFKVLTGGKLAGFLTSLVQPANVAKTAVAGLGASTASAGAATATASAVGRKGFAGFLSGALGAAGGISGAVGTILRVVGLAVSWVGWAALAVMVGGILIKWVSDIEIGGKTVGQRMGDLMANVGETISGAINGARLAFWNFLQGVVGDTDYIRGKIDSVKHDAQRSKAEADRMRNGGEVIPEKIQRWGKAVADIEQLRKDKIVTTKQQVGGSAAVGDVPGAQGGMQNVVSVKRGAQFSDKTDKHVDVILDAMQKQGWTVNSEGKTVKFSGTPKSEKSKKKDDWQPEGWNPTATDQRKPDEFLPSRVGDPSKVRKSGSGKGAKGGEYEKQDAFMADYQNQLLRTDKNDFKIQELLGNAVSYQDQAKNEFAKKWVAGEFDDGRDPSQRKFANRKYDKSNPFTEDDINFSAVGAGGVGPSQWIEAVAQKLQKQAEQDAIKFSAGKYGESSSRFDDSLDAYTLGVTPDSTQASASKRQYAKYEQKNPIVTQNNAQYADIKALSLAALAGEEYVNKVTEYRKSNYENILEFDEDEIANSRKVTNVKFEEGKKQRDAYIKNVEEQLAELEKRGLQEQDVYKKLKAVYVETSKDMTEFNRRELLRRQRETESAYDQQMRMWRDYESTITDTLSSFGQRGATDLWDIILGDQKLDLRGYFSDAFAEIGGDLFKSAWGGISKSLMGSGEGTNAFDYIRNLIQGTNANEDGALGKWLNSSREDGGLLNKLGGMLGSSNDDSFLGKLGTMLGNVFTKGRDTELQGDQAVNANTTATVSLTQAVTGLASQLTTGSMSAGLTPKVAGDFTQPNSLFDGFQFGITPNQGQSDFIVPPFQIPELNPISQQSNPLGSLDQAETGGLFEGIKQGFSTIFDASGEGGIFSKIQTGFSSLFGENSGLMSSIGGSFGSIFSSLGSMLSGLFGAGSTGSRLAGGMTGAMNGFANGGWGGAIAGGIQGMLQSAKGNAFGSSGHIKAFAKGGEFSNTIVSSPTFFKFAKGGQFSNGVMGEAGPEAVMPLKRDGQGRLGVSLHGDAGGGTNNVSININVSNDGSSSSKSTGEESSQWKSMSNRVRMVVLEELVKQKRPGGTLSK